MSKSTVAIVHYSLPPIIGGVEVVIKAHAELLVAQGYPLTLVGGRGQETALPQTAELVKISEVDSRHSEILAAGAQLEAGTVPDNFDALTDRLYEKLAPVLNRCDHVIIHNVFTKRFNLPLTAALHQLLDDGTLQHAIAWCHDFDWTSPRSREKVHPGHPWDLLRTHRPAVDYVVVSKQRQQTLAELFDVPAETIQVIYNGVNPRVLLGLSEEGAGLVERLGLLNAELILLMPVRVTHAKNVEFALRVVAALKEQACDVKLILTGPPDPHDEASMDYYHSLQELRADLGVEDEMRFVFESGPDPDEGYTIGEDVVADLFRVGDVVFMPSHREGFGMPVLEAGLVGLPVMCTEMPAAQELAAREYIPIEEDDTPERIAARLLVWAQQSRVHRLRERVRQKYTWQAIYQRQIKPLLQTECGS
jgi:glycosyltransferase involved in cell wall biosynthesis